MADLAAALDALTPARRGGRCGVAAYLDRLAGRDAALHARVVGLIDDPEVQATRLAVALDADGAGLSEDSIRRHRRRSTGGGCRCPR